MDVFPADYIVHNLPLILVSGLEADSGDSGLAGRDGKILQDGGFRIRTEAPALKQPKAQELKKALLQYDRSSDPWNGKHAAQEQKPALRIQSIGRTFTLPARKALPPPHSPRLHARDNNSAAPTPMVLHSVLSPLTPSSPLYPDGLMSPLWVTKHQSRLPAVFVSVFSLVADPDAGVLEDNKLKSEINNIRSVLGATNYKLKLILVLLADESIDRYAVEERINNLRRATGLDSKSVWYLPAESSHVEIAEFAKTLVNNLQPTAIEYYRDLSKHARRKRNRNVAPQPTVAPGAATHRALNLQGWIVRYEFKLGIFAEFRQEMDAAVKNYEASYETLLGPDVLQKMDAWGPRYNEARMLVDIIAIRIIRCLLWQGQTTPAARWWASHKTRMQEMIVRRGASTATYGWEAWQSMWSRTMSDLMVRTQILPSPNDSGGDPVHHSLLIHSEKTLPADERYSPWESLHHEGYWLNNAQRRTKLRRERAKQIPEDDRMPPTQSPSTAAAKKAHLIDNYLIQEPYAECPANGSLGYDYTGEILRTIDFAIEFFTKHDQPRMAEVLRLEAASELVKSASWTDAISILLPLWRGQRLRHTGWWILLAEIGRTLRLCALESGNSGALLQLDWELCHPLLNVDANDSSIFESTQSDLQPHGEAGVTFNSEEALCELSSTFAFAAAEGNVGQPVDVQLAVRNLALANAPTLKISEIEVGFNGPMRPLRLVHKDAGRTSPSPSAAKVLYFHLDDASSEMVAEQRHGSVGASTSFHGEANLTSESGQITVFEMRVIPREAGDVSVASVTCKVHVAGHDLAVSSLHADVEPRDWWESRKGAQVRRPFGGLRDVSAMKVLPKPPKLDIQVPGVARTFYADEQIVLKIELLNMEDEAVAGIVEIRLISPSKHAAVLQWQVDGEDEFHVTEPTSIAQDAAAFIQILPPRTFGDLASNGTKTTILSLSNTSDALDHELEITVKYALASAPNSTLTKLLTIDLPLIRPFEANFGFQPRLESSAWPNFFSAESLLQEPSVHVGIKQQYLVAAMIASFALEKIEIVSTRLLTRKLLGKIECQTSSGRAEGAENPAASIALETEQIQRFLFDMTVQKHSLGDQVLVTVDFELEIIWKRLGSVTTNRSVLHVPQFRPSGTEPRVLLQVAKDNTLPSACNLTYTLENPSLHFLTFNLVMESSDDFAFSGAKAKTLSLTPISRHSVTYRIIPNKTSSEWLRIHLEVVDAYFGQTLKPQPASDGIKIDKQGNIYVKT